MQLLTKAHLLDDSRSDVLGVHQGLEGGNILGQKVLVDTTKHAEKGAQRRTRTFTAVAMHLASPITIIIASPFVLAVADRGVLRVKPGVVRAFL